MNANHVSSISWFDRRQQRIALRDAFAFEITQSRPNWQWCDVTLTMKQRAVIGGAFQLLDKEEAHKAVKELLKRLNQKVYKNGYRRYKRHLACLPVVERGKSGERRFHIHMLLEVPERMWHDVPGFVQLVEEAWAESPWAHRKRLLRPLQTDTSAKGWINYLLKDYAEDDGILDAANVHYGHQIH